VTVTKRILQSEKTSKQQYIVIIVVLSDYANNATYCAVLLWQYSFVNVGKYNEWPKGMNGK
jgi:hypothetical protein